MKNVFFPQLLMVQVELMYTQSIRRTDAGSQTASIQTLQLMPRVHFNLLVSCFRDSMSGSISGIINFLGKSSAELNPPQKCLYSLITLDTNPRKHENKREIRVPRWSPIGTAFKTSRQYSEKQRCAWKRRIGRTAQPRLWTRITGPARSRCGARVYKH